MNNLAVSLLYAASASAHAADAIAALAALGRVMRAGQGGRWAVVLPGGSVERFRSKSRARRRARRGGGAVRRWRRGRRASIWPCYTHDEVEVVSFAHPFQDPRFGDWETMERTLWTTTTGLDPSSTKKRAEYLLHDPPYGLEMRNNASINPVAFAEISIPAPSLGDFADLFRDEKKRQ